MPGNYGTVGLGQAYQEMITGGQRYGAMTQDAFDPVAAAPVRAVGPSPIPVVAGGVSLTASSSDGFGTSGMYGGSVWDPRTSVTPWIIGGLIVGVLWLHIVHFS